MVIFIYDKMNDTMKRYIKKLNIKCIKIIVNLFKCLDYVYIIHGMTTREHVNASGETN